MKTLICTSLLFALFNPCAYSAQKGEPAPPCAATVAGSPNRLDLAAYQGKVLLIDFWATWCPPCKKSMPFLNSLRNQRLQEGFEIVAINLDENSQDAMQYLQDNPVDYSIAFDPSGDCPQKFDVKAMPSSYLLDKTGKIREIHLGYRDEDQTVINDQISALLAE